MSNILAGLFGQHSDYKRLEQELEDSGFSDSEYIVYLTEDHHNSQYLASVEIKDNDLADNVRQIFGKNHAQKTYLFENMSIEQASYSNLRKYIDARSKAEIHDSPNVKIKQQHNGIDSEVKF